MDIKSLSSKYDGYSIDQYCPPPNYELAGKDFLFIMDDGYDYRLSVIDGKKLEWNLAGEAPNPASYLCQKGDETTYLLSFVLEGVRPRASHSFVIDLENMLVTRAVSRMGLNPKDPYIVKTEFEFGVIAQEGVELPLKRHSFTSDLIGTAVEWTYGAHLTCVHAYYCANYYRITYPRNPHIPDEIMRANWPFDGFMSLLPSSDEPTSYIKIKDGIYLFSLTELNQNKLIKEHVPFRSMNMLFLQNYNRLFQVGRSFGTIIRDGEDEPVHINFGAYGRLAEVDEDFLNQPNPFTT